MKKIIAVAFLALFLFGFSLNNSEAYVRVKGYYRSNGTYVAPHVRSNPNGLKYDNYSYTPSQGLYNPTYGTRGATWDTPTYVTDPNYYEGKALYESGSSGTKTPSTYYTPSSTTATKKIVIPVNASLSYFGDSWNCNSGYKKNYTSNKCDKVVVPANASLSYLGDDWYCNDGYKSKYDAGFSKIGCEKVKIPPHASLSYLGNDWYCDDGYKTKYNDSFDKVGCEKIIVPKNATLSYLGNDWYCNDGYEAKYDENFNKVGCKRE